MSNRTITMTDGLYDYLLKQSLREPELLQRLRQETARLSNAGMQIAPEQGQLMALLIHLIGARRCIEVGVFTGYSSLCVAQALPEDGEILACDVSHDYTATAREYWNQAGVARKIDLRIAPALQTLEQQLSAGASESFDFAFIDADKSNYLRYYELCLALIRPGGLIAIDNTLWSGRVIDAADTSEDTEAIRRFNEFLHDDDRIDLSLVPIGDGLTLARKRES